MKITSDSIKRFRLAEPDMAYKSDEEITFIISEIMKTKRSVDRSIESRVERKNSYQIDAERSRLANNRRRNYER